jgi:hypothetical protein
MAPNRLLIAAISILVAMDAEASARQLRGQDYNKRSGETEAQADLAAGRPVKLYAHVFNGRAPGYKVPGLLDCNPGLAKGSNGKALFSPLPDADWQEGETYSAEHYRRAEAANRFAIQYNRAMFRARKLQIVQVCPGARLEGETSPRSH